MSQPNIAPAPTTDVSAAPLPPAVAQLASQWGLGALRQVFPPHRRLRFLLLSGGFFALMGLLAVLLAVSDPSPDAAGQANQDGGLIFMVVLAVVALAGFVAALRFSPITARQVRDRKIYVFENGYVQVTSSAAAAYRWDRIAAIFQEIFTVRYNGVSTGTQYRYRIEFADGRKAKLNTFTADMSKLGPVLQEETAKVQVPHAFAMMRAGQWVNFGPFALSGAGLVVHDKPPVPWAEVSTLQLFNGRIFVSRANTRGRYANIQASKVPNLATFLVVARQLIASRGQL
jgi:hypothetical protein